MALAALTVVMAYPLVMFLLLRVAHKIPPWVDADYPLFALQAFFVFVVAAAVRMPPRSAAFLGIPSSGLRAVFWLLLGGVLIALLFSVTVISTSSPSSVGFSIPNGVDALTSRFPNTGLVGGLLRLAVLAPIVEEFLFRALILGYLLRAIRPWLALTVSTALFVSCHHDWLVPAFIGFSLGLLYLRHRNVWLCVLAHAGHNLLASVAVPLTMAYLYEAELFTPITRNLLVLQVSWLVVALACFAMFFLQVLGGSGGEKKMSLVRLADAGEGMASARTH